MNHQPSLTIVSITGNADYTEGSKYAIIRSYHELKEQIDDLRCILISPNKPESFPDYITHIPCQPFSYLEYNLFVIFSLAQFINTDFALIVQNDGWVVNGKNWDNDFFHYDYIGAPMPMFVEPNSIEHKPDYWLENYQNPPKNKYEPQNGGFSLRSKKLLEAPRKLNLKWNIAAPKLFETAPLKFKWKNGDHHEDIYLSIGIREILEEHHIRFAPTSIAAKFAVENAFIHQTLGINPECILGCHTAGTIVLTNENEVNLNYVLPSVEHIRYDFVAWLLYQLGYSLNLNTST